MKEIDDPEKIGWESRGRGNRSDGSRDAANPRDAAGEEPKGMWLAALLSSGAALATVLLAVQSIADFQDPFGGFLNSIWTVLR